MFYEYSVGTGLIKLSRRQRRFWSGCGAVGHKPSRRSVDLYKTTMCISYGSKARQVQRPRMTPLRSRRAASFASRITKKSRYNVPREILSPPVYVRRVVRLRRSSWTFAISKSSPQPSIPTRVWHHTSLTVSLASCVASMSHMYVCLQSRPDSWQVHAD